MAKIAELYGVRPCSSAAPEYPHRHWLGQYCPSTGRKCDVTANRGDRAYLDPRHDGVSEEEGAAIVARYGSAPLPLGICSVETARQNETVARPWILCPKRLFEVRHATDAIRPEIKAMFPISPGTLVRCWWEVKFRVNEAATSDFFEYTFDYLLVPITRSPSGRVALTGPPYIIEVMTSSTRGGGLTEHMVDVLLGRDQRRLGAAVKSPYTPNYRQVFERMLGQLFAKSEIAEAWGGRTVWLVQDVLLDYIRQTTAFRPEPFSGADKGNTHFLVYSLDAVGERGSYELAHRQTLRGFSRPPDTEPNFTSMLGLGFAPPVEALYRTLEGGARRRGQAAAQNWVDLTW